jgi:hypothetical protein
VRTVPDKICVENNRMSNDDRIVELLVELVQKVDQLTMQQKVDQLTMQVAQLSANQIETNKRLDRLERQQAKTNVLLQEHSLSILKLADKMDVFVDHSKRISRLEEAVFH